MTSNAAQRAHPDSTRPLKYRVGIRFTLLGNPHDNSDEDMNVKHWCLVFTPADEPSTCRTVEITFNRKLRIVFVDQQHNIGLHSFVLAEFRGVPSDVERILEAHPARGSIYSPYFNNCQHFAATFLLFLQSLANVKPNRTF
jgi:hypothetical protein